MQTFILSEDVLFQQLDNESVILDIKTERYFGLNQVGTRVWQLLPKYSDLEVLLSILLAEYDIEENILRQDITELLDALVLQELVKKVA